MGRGNLPQRPERSLSDLLGDVADQQQGPSCQFGSWLLLNTAEDNMDNVRNGIGFVYSVCQNNPEPGTDGSFVAFALGNTRVQIVMSVSGRIYMRHFNNGGFIWVQIH